MSRTRIKHLPVMTLLAAAAGLSLASTTASADIDAYAAARVVGYSQTSDAPPTDPEGWYLVALVTSDTNNEIVSGALDFAGPAPMSIPLYEATVNLHQHHSGIYTDYAAFMADYPPTTYTLSVDRGAGLETGSVYLSEDHYCPEIPALTGDTFTRMQTLDPSVDFTGSINGFTLAEGTNSGWTWLSVVSIVEGEGPGWVALLDRDETSFTIPAGTLAPDVEYSIGITYFNQILTADAGFGAADSGEEFHRGTNARFNTRHEIPPCPADFNLSGEVTVQDIFDYLTAYFGNDARADFNGSGEVGVQDIFDFLAAYFAGC